MCHPVFPQLTVFGNGSSGDLATPHVEEGLDLAIGQ